MRRLGFALLFLAPLASGSARAATQGYALSPFSGIRVEAPVRLIVRAGRGASASAEGDRKTLDRLKLTVSGDQLTVKLAPQAIGADTTRPGPVTISLSTGQLTRLMLNGSGTIEVDRLAGERGSIVIAGAGQVKIGAMALDRLALSLSGNGGATMAGSARIADIGLTGAGTIDGKALSVGQLSLSAEGNGNVTMTVTGSADVKALGAGDITVTGKTACKVDHKGSGRVQCAGKEW